MLQFIRCYHYFKELYVIPYGASFSAYEVSFSDKVAKRLEQIIEEMKNQNLEIAVTRYIEKVA